MLASVKMGKQMLRAAGGGHGVFGVMVCYRQRVRKSTAGCLMR